MVSGGLTLEITSQLIILENVRKDLMWHLELTTGQMFWERLTKYKTASKSRKLKEASSSTGPDLCSIRFSVVLGRRS